MRGSLAWVKKQSCFHKVVSNILNEVVGIGFMWKQQGQLEKTTFGGGRDNSPVYISSVKWEMSAGEFGLG